MKLVGYVRVSTESQEENTSLDCQRQKIEAYCLALGHDLIEVFVEVGSGKNMKDRPEFQKAIASLDNADGLIAMKLDRVARNCRDVLTLVEDVLAPKDKSLILLDLNVDTASPTGKMILTMMAAVAELERSQINERTQGGRKAKAIEGRYAYGSPRFGKQSIETELATNDSEAATIEIIRKHRKSGKSFQSVAKYLNENNKPSKRGRKWSAMTIKRVCDRLKS